MNPVLIEMHQKYDLSEYGFFPGNGVRQVLPEYFAPWERLRQIVTQMIKDEQFGYYVERSFPTLICDSSHLPDSCLRTASIYISNIAHAYAYEFRRKCQNPKASITFPKCIEQPWQQVSLRMSRSCPQALFYELHSWNVDSNCERVFFNVFDSNTSNKFVCCFARVEKTLGQTVPEIYAIDKYLSTQTLTHNELRSYLLRMLEPIYTSVKVMREMINTSRFDSKFFVNPTLWAKTTASIGASTRDGELGMSGGAAPIFRLLDIFLGRKMFTSELGRQMTQKTYLAEHTLFIDLIKANIDTIHKFLFAEKDTTNLFRQIAQLYYGERGYLGIHQKKVYGFMLVGLSAGRDQTNGGTLKTTNNNAVHQLDNEFCEARRERAMHIKSNYPLRLCVKKSTMMGDEARHLIFDVSNQLFRFWPGDKLSITPKNPNELVLDLLKRIKQLLEHMPDILLSKACMINLKWTKYIEEQNLESDLQSTEDLLRIIFTYGDLKRNFNSQIYKHYKFDYLEASDFLNYMNKLIQDVKFERQDNFLEFLDWLLASIEPMSHRYYSICTSQRQLEDSGEIGVCVGLLKYKTDMSTMRSGVCSSYLHMVKLGEIVEARLVYAYWKVPEIHTTPIIIIAGGTGLAPMMSLIKARVDAGCIDNHLFFVTKNINAFYFRDELEELVNSNKLKLYGAFTRDSKSCSLIKSSNTDIGTLLTSQRNMIALAIAKQNASVYVCGRLDFGLKCEQTIVKILEDTLKRDLVSQLLVNMKHNGKYVEETFTSYNQKLKERSLLPIHIMDVLSNDNHFEMLDLVYDVSEFKKVHPGGDFVFLVASENDYDQVHAKDLVAKNRLDSLLVGRVACKEDFDPRDLDELRKLKKLIGKYYCATDIPAQERTASLLIEHQNSFVQNFHDYFVSSSIEVLCSLASHKQFKESAELIKVVTCNLPQDFAAFLWEKVEKFNFDFLFSLRVYLVNLVREEKFTNACSSSLDAFQNPYEMFSKYIFRFRKVKPRKRRDTVNTIKKRRLSRLGSITGLQSSPIILENEIKNIKEKTKSVKINHNYYLDLALFVAVVAFFVLIFTRSFDLKYVLAVIVGIIYSVKKKLKIFHSQQWFLKFLSKLNELFQHIKEVFINPTLIDCREKMMDQKT